EDVVFPKGIAGIVDCRWVLSDGSRPRGRAIEVVVAYGIAVAVDEIHMENKAASRGVVERSDARDPAIVGVYGFDIRGSDREEVHGQILDARTLDENVAVEPVDARIL